MRPRVYYNEFDPFAAQWIRELIKGGVVAPGEVDERSIVDVKPDDLKGYTQCHFFAGIATWSWVLRNAGWDDTRPVWTASLPCQPFSNAGKRKAADDERHLWPVFYELVRQCNPVAVLGEQVESKDGRAWFSNVHLQMEGIGYTVGNCTTPASGFGSPHARHRLYWAAIRMGDSECNDVGRYGRAALGTEGEGESRGEVDGSCGVESGLSGSVGSVPHSPSRITTNGDEQRSGQHGLLAEGGRVVQTVPDPRHEPTRRSSASGETAGRWTCGDFAGCGSSLYGSAGHTSSTGSQRGELQGTGGIGGGPGELSTRTPGATNGFWADCVWLPCSDGKWRAVEPSLEPIFDGLAGDLGRVCVADSVEVFFPLVQETPNRAARIRGYGNGLVAPQAIEVVKSLMEVLDEKLAHPTDRTESGEYPLAPKTTIA